VFGSLAIQARSDAYGRATLPRADAPSAW